MAHGSIKSIVSNIYNNKPKIVKENLVAAINEKATQVLESRKVKVAKSLLGHK